MLTVRLDDQTEKYLADLVACEKTDKSELIRRLIRERWLANQSGLTVVERLGGHPKHLLENAPPNLSERSIRKQAIARHLQDRHSQ